MNDRSGSGGMPTPEDAAGVLAGAGRFARQLAVWAAEGAVDEAARRRAQQRWLEATAAEAATVIGTLLSLAERGQAVSIAAAATRVRGRVAGVGSDFVALQAESGDQLLIAITGVEAIQADPGTPAVVGDRADLGGASLAGLLTGVAGDRPDVLVRSSTGTATRGQLRSVGADVVHLVVDGDPPAPAWIPLSSIAMLVVR